MPASACNKKLVRDDGRSDAERHHRRQAVVFLGEGPFGVGPACHESFQSVEFLLVYFFNVPATTEIYTLSLHDALPISSASAAAGLAISKYRPPSPPTRQTTVLDRKSTRLNSSHLGISYAVFCLKK